MKRTPKPSLPCRYCDGPHHRSMFECIEYLQTQLAAKQATLDRLSQTIAGAIGRIRDARKAAA